MKKHRLSIQEAAQETGLGPDTLRYYERIGLIDRIERADNGHRQYCEQDIVWINFLKQLRATGMSIAQMKEFAQLRRDGDGSIPERIAMLEEHRRKLEEQVESIVSFMSVIDFKIARHKKLENNRMNTSTTNWIDEIVAANRDFTNRINPDKLPVARTPGAAVITCMDPRVNLEAIGIPQFTQEGEGNSSVRIIRTLGAMADNRSLIVGIFLAGIHEITLIMHSDCGCCLAHSKIGSIIENMQNRLSPTAFQAFRADIGEPFEENLQSYLKTFDNPREAVKQEIEAIKSLPFIPDNLILHGLVYTLETGHIDVIVNGYA